MVLLWCILLRIYAFSKLVSCQTPQLPARTLDFAGCLAQLTVGDAVVSEVVFHAGLSYLLIVLADASRTVRQGMCCATLRRVHPK